MGPSVALWFTAVGLQTVISVVVANKLLLLATSQTSGSFYGMVGLIVLAGIDIGSLFFWLPKLK